MARAQTQFVRVPKKKKKALLTLPPRLIALLHRFSPASVEAVIKQAMGQAGRSVGPPSRPTAHGERLMFRRKMRLREPAPITPPEKKPSPGKTVEGRIA